MDEKDFSAKHGIGIRTPRDLAIQEEGDRARLAELKEYWAGRGNVPTHVLKEMDRLDRHFHPEKYTRGMKLDDSPVVTSAQTPEADETE